MKGKRKMIEFTSEEKRVIKYSAIVMGLALAGILAISLAGCSSMSISNQKKAATLIGQQIEFVAVQVAEECNSGKLKREDCETMADLVNFALDAKNAYTRTLIAMQNGTGSQEQVQKALEVLQNDIAALVSNAISLGIRFR